MTGSGRSGIAGLLTALNGLTACLALCAIGLYVAEAAGALHVLLLAGAALYQRWRWSGRGGAPDARRAWWEAAAFFTLFFFVADLFVVTRDLIGAALRLLGFIVAYHADNPQAPRGARQTLALTFIQMLAAAASTTEVGFSVLMAAYLFAFLWTLAALGAAEREGGAVLSPAAPARPIRVPLLRLTGAVTPAVVGLGLAVFFCVPHYGTGYFREQGQGLRRSLSGFSDRIELGSIGSIKKSHATVMRVRMADSGAAPPLPLRMRGIALDRWDGRSWSVGDARKRWLRPDERGAYVVAPDLLPPGSDPSSAPAGSPRERRGGPRWLALEILLEPLDAPVLFTPPNVVTVTMVRFVGVGVDRQGSVFSGITTMRRFPYRTVSLVPRAPAVPSAAAEPPGGSEPYLMLPPLDAGIVEVAHEQARGAASAEEKARRLERHLRENYAYSLDVDDAGVVSPLAHFLIERKPGHCEYFATALAVLLRVEGIPARVVNGFYGGDHSDLTGQTVLRQSDAHSWVEAWIPGSGWVTLDPTPPDTGAASAWSWLGRVRRLFEETEIAWDSYIVGLDLEDQRSILEDARDRVDLALAGAVIRLRRLAAALDDLLGNPGRRVSGALLLLLLAAAGALAAWAVRRAFTALASRRRGPGAPHPATLIFARFERRCARQGLRRDPWTSPAAFARLAGAPEVAAAFEAARYGPPEKQKAEVGRLRRVLEGTPYLPKPSS